MTDWKLARAEFEKGASFRTIAKHAGGSPAAIHKRAHQDKWQRLVVKVEQAPERKPPPVLMPVHDDARPELRISPIITAAAAEIPQVVRRGREIIVVLLRELEAESANFSLLQEIMEFDTATDKTASRKRMLAKALSLPTRAQAAKNLATALAALAPLPGKKAQKQADADEAGRDSGWGDLLDYPTKPN